MKLKSLFVETVHTLLITVIVNASIFGTDYVHTVYGGLAAVVFVLAMLTAGIVSLCLLNKVVGPTNKGGKISAEQKNAV